MDILTITNSETGTKEFKCEKCSIVGNCGFKCSTYPECNGYVILVNKMIQKIYNWCDHIDCLESIESFDTEEDMEKHKFETHNENFQLIEN